MSELCVNGASRHFSEPCSVWRLNGCQISVLNDSALQRQSNSSSRSVGLQIMTSRLLSMYDSHQTITSRAPISALSQDGSIVTQYPPLATAPATAGTQCQYVKRRPRASLYYTRLQLSDGSIGTIQISNLRDREIERKTWVAVSRGKVAVSRCCHWNLCDRW